MPNKQKIIRIAIAIVVLAIIGALSYIAVSAKSDAKRQLESQQLQTSFITRYGTNAELVSITKPTEFYMFYWKDSEKIHVTMFVDGVWVELGSQQLQEQQESEPTPNP